VCTFQAGANFVAVRLSGFLTFFRLGASAETSFTQLQLA
jgi:hypothetical protein